MPHNDVCRGIFNGVKKKTCGETKEAFPESPPRLIFPEIFPRTRAPMLRHHVFFETLGTLKEDDRRWRSTLAGLFVLRLVDSIADDATRATATEWTGIEAARTAAKAIHNGDPSRAILLRLLDLVEDRGRLCPEIGGELLSYGRALDLEARWPLAADVFGTIPDVFSARGNPRLVVDACTALGAAARNVGNWEASTRAYAKAQHLADVTGDLAASLTVRVGIADTYITRGNLPAAEEELHSVLAEARANELGQVEALALHAEAFSAVSRGHYQRAVHLAYRSLELTTNQTARDRILGDIAAAYAGLGMRETARDGYSIVAVTSPHQWVRWQATLNLMELAILEGSEELFDDYVQQVADAPLDPRLRAYFLFFNAAGFERFEREGVAAMFATAREYADAHELHQIAFEVDAAMKSSRQSAEESGSLTGGSGVPDGELQRIAEVLMHLRAEATA